MPISPAVSFTLCPCHTSSPSEPKSSAYWPRSASEHLLGVRNILVVLRQMGMQPDPLFPGQNGAVAHQAAAGGER